MPTKTILAILLTPLLLSAQIDYHDLELNYGDHAVGYRHVTLTDANRAYRSLTDAARAAARPVAVSIWEPAEPRPAAEHLQIKDYLRVLATEEEWPALPFEYFFDWFYIPPSPHNRAQAERTTRAVREYDRRETNRPIIVYSASYRASSTENFALGEYLAGHGYTVIALPSKGYERLDFEGGTLKDATAQSEDLRFILSRLPDLVDVADPDIYLSGFSFGGLSHILNAGTDPRIKGVISLDGTIKYQPQVLDAAVAYAPERFDVPFLHFSQKDIPLEVLRREQLDTLINDRFEFYDRITAPVKYQIKVTKLSHSYFATYGLLFNERDPAQDPDYAKIAASYAALSDLVKLSIEQLERPIFDTAAYNARLRTSEHFEIIDHATHRALPGFPEFMRAADLDDLDALKKTYHNLVNEYADFNIPEGRLNTLGLQLIFMPETYARGVNVFQFALFLYPNSANLYDSLAEGYRYHGDDALARENFRKSLALNPDNGNASRRLRELDGE